MKYVKLFENFINESVSKSMEDFLNTKDWAVDTKTSTETIGGYVDHTNFKNKYYKDFTIRIVESPNGIYVEIYQNGRQVTPLNRDINAVSKLDKAMKTYLEHNMKKFGV
jgi:hypothetical protein